MHLYRKNIVCVRKTLALLSSIQRENTYTHTSIYAYIYAPQRLYMYMGWGERE